MRYYDFNKVTTGSQRLFKSYFFHFIDHTLLF